MKYPSREQVKRLFESCFKIGECEQCDLSEFCQIIHNDDDDEYTEMLEKVFDSFHDEIDRLTALVPKVVVPKESETIGDYRCECGSLVGKTYLDEKRNSKQNYCHRCGAKMDWDNAEVME